MIDFINQYLIPALVLGSIYALGAIGISILYSILRFANFAHGDTMAWGAYLGLAVVWVLDGLVGEAINPNVKAFLAIPFAFVGVSVIAIGVDKLFYKPFRASKPIIVVIASFGVALMLRSLIQLVFGVENQNYGVGFIQTPIEGLSPLRIVDRHIYIILVTVALVAALHYMLTRTRTGKAMRAMSDDSDLARVTGIDTEKTIKWTWIVGGGLAATAGVLLGMDSRLVPQMGWDLLLPMFAAAILGGLGRPYGAIAGGFIIGAMEELSTYPWIGDGPLVSPDYKSAVAFGVMVILLIFRPQGIFKGRVI